MEQTTTVVRSTTLLSPAHPLALVEVWLDDAELTYVDFPVVAVLHKTIDRYVAECTMAIRSPADSRDAASLGWHFMGTEDRLEVVVADHDEENRGDLIATTAADREMDNSVCEVVSAEDYALPIRQKAILARLERRLRQKMARRSEKTERAEKESRQKAGQVEMAAAN